MMKKVLSHEFWLENFLKSFYASVECVERVQMRKSSGASVSFSRRCSM